jgi:hypothetical protein
MLKKKAGGVEKNRIWILAVVIVLVFSFLVLAQSGNKYVGVNKCKMCHLSESKGNQFGQWKKTKHATAYQTLATDRAKEIAAKQGITAPQQSDKCLKCHSTAALDSAVDLVAGEAILKLEDGVQCESCHGPGEKYWSITVMKDHDKAVANGMLVPNEAVCVKCHNPDNPVWLGFDFAEKYELITHPQPK